MLTTSTIAATLMLVLINSFSTKLSYALRGVGNVRFKGTSSSRRMALSVDTSPVRVRFAPSPTGSLHVGGARTALYNWLLAKKTKGTFIIRVEDTDEARSTKESEVSILNDLKWMNMDWDEGPEKGGEYGPYRQSERVSIYKAAADKLIEKGFAYRCFCTDEELDAKRAAAEEKGEDPKYDGIWRDRDPAEIEAKIANGDSYTVRFKIAPGKVVSIDDRVRGTVTWDAEACLGDFIILRSSGMPVYNFCVSVDDAEMEITHVIRAEEHLSNTLRQMLLLEALEYEPPTYAHCSLILGSDRTKMSKRHGATSLAQFAEQGFIPNAMMNYLANLGWNDGTDKEIYSPDELIKAFELSRIVKSSAVFDMDKLKWVNKQHLSQMPLESIRTIVIDRLSGGSTPLFTKETVETLQNKSPDQFDQVFTALSKIVQRDMELTIDTDTLTANVLQFDISKGVMQDAAHVEELLKEESFQMVLKQLVDDFKSGSMPTGAEEEFEKLWKTYMKDTGKTLGLKGKSLFHAVRFCLSGRMSGPDVGDQLKLVHLVSSSGLALPTYSLVSLADRISILDKFSIPDALTMIEASK